MGEWMDGLTENDHRMKEYKGVVIKKSVFTNKVEVFTNIHYD